MTGVQECGQTSFDVLTLGEPLVCLTSGSGRLPANRTLTKSIAGAEANLAIGLARLGRAVAILSRVGDDPFGEEIVRTMRGEGVDTSWVVRDTIGPTGLMIKERRGPDDIHVYYYRQGSAAARLCTGDVPSAAARTTRRVHVTGITLALGQGPREAVDELLGQCEAAGVPVSFDPNFRLKLWSVDEAAKVCASVLPAVSDLLVGEEELLAMAAASGARGGLDEALTWLEDFGLSSVVVKRGEKGVIGVKGSERVQLAAYPVSVVVDTVGAGDAFNAGYLQSLLDGDDFETALDLGTWVASRVVSHFGDYEGLPDAAEYRAYRDSRDTVHR